MRCALTVCLPACLPLLQVPAHFLFWGAYFAAVRPGQTAAFRVHQQQHLQGLLLEQSAGGAGDAVSRTAAAAARLLSPQAAGEL